MTATRRYDMVSLADAERVEADVVAVAPRRVVEEAVPEYTDAELGYVLREYAAGVRMGEIAEESGLGVQAVQAIVAQYRSWLTMPMAPRGERRRSTVEQRRRCKEMREEGRTMPEIGRVLGLTENQVRYALEHER